VGTTRGWSGISAIMRKIVACCAGVSMIGMRAATAPPASGDSTLGSLAIVPSVDLAAGRVMRAGVRPMREVASPLGLTFALVVAGGVAGVVAGTFALDRALGGTVDSALLRLVGVIFTGLAGTVLLMTSFRGRVSRALRVSAAAMLASRHNVSASIAGRSTGFMDPQRRRWWTVPV
jgi:hypothetical protein